MPGILLPRSAVKDQPAFDLVPQPTSVVSLRKALAAAANACHELGKKLQAEAKARREAFEDRLSEELKREFGGAIEKATAELAAAEGALVEEKDRLARLGIPSEVRVAGEPPPPPVGTALVEVAKPGGSRQAPPRRGVLEIITTDSEHDIAEAKRADVGTTVVRLLNKAGRKDGKYVHYYHGEWIAERDAP